MTVLWFTGLSGAGKTTLGTSLIKKLEKVEKAILLDGDELRKTINSNLGFSMEDRAENVRRVAHIAKLFSDSGHLVVAALISPTAESRKAARDIIGDKFHEVFIKTDLATCIERDVKGLYKKALAGEVKNMSGMKNTGTGSTYEEPTNPEIVVDTKQKNVEEATDDLLNYLISKNLLKIEFDGKWAKKNYGGKKLSLTPHEHAVFIGRWQPFHMGHREMINRKLEQGTKVLVLVRDIPVDVKNPFTTSQVVEMIEEVYKDKKDMVKIMVIPDIESVNFGRGVGYEVNEYIPDEQIGNISATKIRASMRDNTTDWKSMVDDKLHNKLKDKKI